MQHTRKPAPFSGKDAGDWQRFVREWKPYEQILEKSYPVELHDTVKLEFLKSLLDSTTLADFQTRFEANGSITFQEFWDEIDREHGRDATHQNRTAWKKVKLHQAGKRLTLAEWRSFTKEWDLKRGRVDDRTENEEYSLLMAQLPEYWAMEVGKEECKRDLKGHWVRISNTPDWTRSRMENFLKEYASPKEVQKVDSGYRVNLRTSDDQDAILKMHGTDLDGKRMQVTRHSPRMSAREIIDFITYRLRSFAYTQDLKKSASSDYDHRWDSHEEKNRSKYSVRTIHSDNAGDSSDSDKKFSPPRKSSPPKIMPPRAPSPKNELPPWKTPTAKPHAGRGKGNHVSQEAYRPPHQRIIAPAVNYQNWANPSKQELPPGVIYPFITPEEKEARAKNNGKGQISAVSNFSLRPTGKGNGKGDSRGNSPPGRPMQNRGPRVQQ